jgi:hypothetical protein
MGGEYEAGGFSAVVINQKGKKYKNEYRGT